ncbi:MAG: hypothetical protein RQ756_01820 [Flavobacteriaceae bacterium]|nr:hypothetical protein [Flavobacteriaceae bacterium]
MSLRDITTDLENRTADNIKKSRLRDLAVEVLKTDVNTSEYQDLIWMFNNRHKIITLKAIIELTKPTTK